MSDKSFKEDLSKPAMLIGAACELCGGIALEKFVKMAINNMHESVEYGGIPTRIGEAFLKAGAFDAGSRIASNVFLDCYKVLRSGKKVADAVVEGVKARQNEEEEETDTETVEETNSTDEE